MDKKKLRYVIIKVLDKGDTNVLAKIFRVIDNVFLIKLAL